MTIMLTNINLKDRDNKGTITVDCQSIVAIEDNGKMGSKVYIKGVAEPFYVNNPRLQVLEMMHKKFSEIEEFQVANRGNHQQDEMVRLVSALKEVYTHGQANSQVRDPNTGVLVSTPEPPTHLRMDEHILAHENLWFNDHNGKPFYVPVSIVEKIELPDSVYIEKGIASFIKTTNGLMIASTDPVDKLKSRLKHIASNKTNQPQEPVFLFKDERSRQLPLDLNAIKGVVLETHIHGCSILEMKDGTRYLSNLTSESLAKELKECREKYGIPTTKEIHTYIDKDGNPVGIDPADILRVIHMPLGGSLIKLINGNYIEVKDVGFKSTETDI